MQNHVLRSVSILTALSVACAGIPEEEAATHTYDLVIQGARVMDPASGLDAVRHLGIRNGTIVAVSETPLEGERVIAATGLVVAPGFIDLHQHGRSDEAYGFAVRDGVTSALELEVGVADIDGFYAQREDGQRVNYGASVGHIPVRMEVFDDPAKGLVPAGVGNSATAGPAELAEIERRMREGLEAGAVAAGFGTAYTTGADWDEIGRLFRLAAEQGAGVHIHMRGGVAGLDSTIAAAHEAGAALHIVHVNSSGGDDLTEFLSAIRIAREAGQDVTTEAYPYGASMTAIESALFDDWESWPDERYHDFQWLETGERLDRESFVRYRELGGYVVIHGRSEEQTREAVTSPLTMIASDGYIVDGLGHPRGAGSYSRVLGRYVRQEGVLGLMEALHKFTIGPARRIEARVPDMVRKGRIAVGADADLTIFDPDAVLDRATYTDPLRAPDGIPYVIVNGVLVVEEGELTGAKPGRAIRALRGA
ncbi:MAG: amidohydrolase family protein, partial [Myxococcota bacterium]